MYFVLRHTCLYNYNTLLPQHMAMQKVIISFGNLNQVTAAIRRCCYCCTLAVLYCTNIQQCCTQVVYPPLGTVMIIVRSGPLRGREREQYIMHHWPDQTKKIRHKTLHNIVVCNFLVHRRV